MNDFQLGFLLCAILVSPALGFLGLRELKFQLNLRKLKKQMNKPIPKLEIDPDTAKLLVQAEEIIQKFEKKDD
jgi:hypothetical protein